MGIPTLTRYKTVPGRYYGTPKEVWGFRSTPAPGRPPAVARAFIRANAGVLGLEGTLGQLRLTRVVESLGATHVIYQQRHLGLRVHRAYVTIHVDRARRVYLAKNRAVPSGLLPGTRRFQIGRAQARRRALRSAVRSAAGARVLGVEPLWFPLKARLRPALRVRVHRAAPRQEWIVYVDGATGRILSKYDNLAQVGGRALVFEPNPVIALGDWRALVRRGKPAIPPANAYTEVRLRDLKGTGHLDGRCVTTAPTPRRVRRADHAFLYRSTQAGFDEAMAYHHLDRAIRYLESLGYRGRRAIFRGPVSVNAHGTQDDNSWYSPGLGRLTFGTGGVDDAEDADIILHEFGHAVQDAICPDFGQSPEAAAMGEGFGDYLAASFFADRRPAAFRSLVGTWDAVKYDTREPPYMRRVDEPLTYEAFDHSTGADEHDNGRIWSATLWDIWQALGRAVADRIIIESHFQLDGFTRFAPGARAILDADRHLYRGRHAGALTRIFRRRGIGPVE